MAAELPRTIVFKSQQVVAIGPRGINAALTQAEKDALLAIIDKLLQAGIELEI